MMTRLCSLGCERSIQVIKSGERGPVDGLEAALLLLPKEATLRPTGTVSGF